MTALFLLFVFLVLSGSCGSPLGCSDNPLELPGHFSLFSVQQRKQKHINKQANSRVFFFTVDSTGKKSTRGLIRPSKKILKVLLRRNLSKNNKKQGKGWKLGISNEKFIKQNINQNSLHKQINIKSTHSPFIERITLERNVSERIRFPLHLHITTSILLGGKKILLSRNRFDTTQHVHENEKQQQKSQKK